MEITGASNNRQEHVKALGETAVPPSSSFPQHAPAHLYNSQEEDNVEEGNEDESMAQASIPSTMGVADFEDGTGRMIPIYNAASRSSQTQQPPILSQFIIPPSPWGRSTPTTTLDWTTSDEARPASASPSATAFHNNNTNNNNNSNNNNATTAAAPMEKLEEDDISVLTEYSGMEEDEDASSQITAGTEARTVVTTTTGDTTVPTRNQVIGTPFSNAGNNHSSSTNGHLYQFSNPLPFPSSATSTPSSTAAIKRPSGAIDKLHGMPPLENSQFKRRRVHR